MNKNQENKLSKGVITLICSLLVFSAAIMPAAVFAVTTGTVTEPTRSVVTTAPAPALDVVPDAASEALPAPAPADETQARPEEIKPAPAVDEIDAEEVPEEDGSAAEVPAKKAPETGISPDEVPVGSGLVWVTEPANSISSVQPGVREALGNVDLDALREVLHNGLVNCEEEIKVGEFGIAVSDSGSLLSFILYSMPECFHVGSGYSYSYYSDGTIFSIKPKYLLTTPEEYQAELARCEASASKILSGLIGNDELSDAEKALLIHDRLALWCEYDPRYYTLGSAGIPTISHRMNGALADGVAVCEGYALAYGYLLDQVGIENYYVSSTLLNHAWNIVYIDGKPYHVDVTWDDPTGDVTGRVNHNNFLRSTNGLISTNHVENGEIDYDATPVDTTYDNAYWQNSQTAFQYLAGSLYYIDSPENNVEGWLCRVADGKTEQLVNITGYWDASSIWGSGYVWSGNYTRLACDGVNLLYSTPTSVYEYNPITGSNTVVWTPNRSGYEIYGFTWRDGEMICDLNNTPSFEGDGSSGTELRQAHTVRIAGDADGDGTVAPMDVALLQQYLNGLDVDIDTSLCDVDGDGRVTMRDLVLIRQYLNGLEVTLQ